MNRRPARAVARLAAILDSLPDGLLVVDRHGLVVNANAVAHEAFVVSDAALVGRPLREVLPGFTRGSAQGARGGARAEGAPGGGAAGGAARPERLEARRTDGSVFPVEVKSADLPGAYGEGLLLVIRDLTDAGDAETELRQQQRQTEMILRATSEGICGVDAEGRIVIVNPAAARMLHYRANELGGKHFHDLLHHSKPDGGECPGEECPILETLRSGTKQRLCNETLWRSDDEPVLVELSTAPVREGDTMVGAVVTFSDQSAVQAMSQRHDELVTLLEDEVYTPLRKVQRALGRLGRRELTEIAPQTRDRFERLVAETQRLGQILDDVLELQRIETGETQLRHRTVDMGRLVHQAVEATAHLAEVAGVEFSVRASSFDIVVDEQRMVQALTHLFAAALAVSEVDSEITVAATRRGDVARLEVRASAGEGNPLHLALARGIVARHNGAIYEQADSEKANSYVVELPLGDTSSSEKTGEQRPRGDSAAEAAPARSEKTPDVTPSSGAAPITSNRGLNGVRKGDAPRRPLTPSAAPIPIQARGSPEGAQDDEASGDTGEMPAAAAARSSARTAEAAPRTREEALPEVEARTRNLLVWPEPDGGTAGVLRSHGFKAVLVQSGEELGEHVSDEPAALLVDPLTGPITRATLQSLHTGAAEAEIPFVVTAGLEEAVPDAAQGADPSVLLRALAPRSNPARVPRVLLVEDSAEVGAALEAGLRQRGLEVVRTQSEGEAVSRASSAAPDLVVLDLMRVRRRRLGVVDWLREQDRLTVTPLIVYTAPDIEDTDLAQLRHGQTVLYLAERSTRADVQQHIIAMLSKISRVPGAG
ncbi:MAG: PAS domain-containing protein [Carbonactinosporaceae bacterium]